MKPPTPKYPHACLRCGHEWNGILATPACCPACKSYFWFKPRVRELAQRRKREEN